MADPPNPAPVIRAPYTPSPSAQISTTADAREKATLYATAAGNDLGSVQSISETQGGGEPQPYMMKSMAMDTASAPVPVQAGELSYAINVNVTWVLDDK